MKAKSEELERRDIERKVLEEAGRAKAAEEKDQAYFKLKPKVEHLPNILET